MPSPLLIQTAVHIAERNIPFENQDLPVEMVELVQDVKACIKRFNRVNFIETIRSNFPDLRRFIALHRGISFAEAHDLNKAKRIEFHGSFPEEVNQDIMKGHQRWVTSRIFAQM